MSFGFSVGDILAVSKLALSIWGRFQDSSDQFKAIRTEFRSLYLILDDAAQNLPGLKLSQEQIDHLELLTNGSRGVLEELSAVIKEYESLDVEHSTLKSKTRKTWKKSTWDEQTIRDLRDRIVSNTALLNIFITGLANTAAQSTNDKIGVLDERVQDLKSHNDNQERTKILDWLSPLNFSSQETTNLDQRQEGTGVWLLESIKFQEWVNNKRATLLCTGMPGAGKTMLASIAIEHLTNMFRSQQGIGVAYIFCDYKGQSEQTSLNLIASLLKQLLQHQHSISDGIRRMYERHNACDTRPSLDEAFESLQLTVASFSQVYIVVDALDELQQETDILQTLLSKFSALIDINPVNLMLTSREVPHVLEKIQNEVRLEVRARDEDVNRYVDGHMYQFPTFVSRSPKFQEDIKKAIVSVVDGMFLLARLHLESLMDKLNPAELRRAIKSLPSGIEALSTAYGQAMCRINAQMPGMSLLAQKAMSWITYAKRLLSVVELQYALGVQPKTSEFDEENLYDIADIISACGGLVVVDKRLSSETVRLVHFSTQEFLRQAGGRYFPDAQHKIATSCLTYLIYGCFREGWPFDPTSDEGSWCDNQILCAARRELRYPLLLYAAQHWAALMGHSEIVELLLSLNDNGVNRISLDDRCGGSCLASEKESERGAQSSGFKKSTRLDARDTADLADPVLRATEDENFASLKELSMLSTVDVNFRDRGGKTPLAVAFIGGIYSRNDDGLKPSRFAADRAHVATVRLLVARADVDVNLKATDGLAPLHQAMQDNSGVIVQILLSHAGTDVNIQCADGITPLMIAAMRSHEAIAGSLIAHHSIDVNCKAFDGRTALSIAAHHGTEAIVNSLLKCTGIDVNSIDDYGHTPLSRAVYGWLYKDEFPAGYRGLMFLKQEAIVKLLLTHPDIDIDCIDKTGNNLLSRVTEYAPKPPEPKFEGIIYLLRAAMEGRFGGACED